MIARDYAPAGKQLRRALWKKAAALKRQQARRVLCDPALPSDFDQLTQARIWARIKAVITPRHCRTAEDCQ